MTENPVYVLALLALGVLLSELLARRPGFRALGTALLVIVVAALAANLGVIPTYSRGVALYDGIFAYVAPLGVFWLLLRVNLRDVLKAGAPMLALFLVGAAGTMVGVVAAMAIVDGPATIGAQHRALGGMFVGTYIGGSVNFNAIALAYGVQRDGALYAGANAVDSIATTVWMAATLVIPKLLRRGRTTAPPVAVAQDPAEMMDVERVHTKDVALLVALGAGAVWTAQQVEAATGVHWMLALTTIALALAQVRAVNRLPGSYVLGITAVYLFLAVIGTLCDVRALAGLGALGGTLLLLVCTAVAIHGAVVFCVALLFRQDPDVAAVASQANIGGGTTALALARGLGRPDLVLPGILVGSLGTALGTFAGFFAAEKLLVS